MLVAALTATLALAQPAAAETYCVGSPGGTCDQSYPFTGSGLTSAVNAAYADTTGGSDTVKVAAGSLSTSSGVVLDTPSGDVLEGAGKSATVITNTGTGAVALAVSGVGNGVRDLSLITTALTSGSVTKAIAAANGATVDRVFTEDLNPSNTVTHIGLDMVGSATTATEVTVLSHTDQDLGFRVYGGSLSDASATFDGSVTNNAAIQAGAAGETILLSRVTTNGYGGGLSLGGGTVNVSDSLIRPGTGAGQRAIFIDNGNSTPTSVNLTRTTVAGNVNGQVGVRLAPTNGGTASLSLIDSVVSTVGTSSEDVQCNEPAGTTSSISLTRAAYGTIGAAAGCAITGSPVVDLTSADPGFRDRASGDFRLRSTSPLIDAGQATASLLPPTDLAGNPRRVDGNTSGTAQVDIGAYEFQRAAPTFSAFTVPATATVGQTVTLSAAAADLDGEPITYSWSLSDGRTASGSSLTTSFAAPGTYTATLTATDELGQTVTQAGQIAVSAAPVPTATVTVAKKPTASIKRGKKGFALGTASKRTATLNLSATTQLTFTLTRLTPGRLSGGKCKPSAKSGKRCTKRTSVKGSQTLPVSGASATVSFGGGFGGRKLAAGRYEVQVVPVNASGTKGTPVTFTVTLK